MGRFYLLVIKMCLPVHPLITASGKPLMIGDRR